MWCLCCYHKMRWWVSLSLTGRRSSKPRPLFFLIHMYTYVFVWSLSCYHKMQWWVSLSLTGTRSVPPPVFFDTYVYILTHMYTRNRKYLLEILMHMYSCGASVANTKCSGGSHSAGQVHFLPLFLIYMYTYVFYPPLFLMYMYTYVFFG